MTDAQPFNRGFRFAKGDFHGANFIDYDDNAWEEVILPHTWNHRDMAPGQPPAKAYIGPAWYRKPFPLHLPQGRRAHLCFEAAANESRVWVNGAYVGGRDGGFLSFRLDVTDALSHSGQNMLAVRVSNLARPDLPPPQAIDWERYGGLYRPVWLVETGDAYFQHKSIRVFTPQVSEVSAHVAIDCRIQETLQGGRPLIIRHRVLDAAGAEVAAAETTLPSAFGRTISSRLELPEIIRPQLWSPQSPSLYRVESLLLRDGQLLDRQLSPLGFRWFRFHPDRGFFLNGQPMKLCGANVHQDFPGLGSAMPQRCHRADIEQMKAAGMNFLRGSHYPRHRAQLEACDELGVMVMEEQPFWHGSVRACQGEAAIVQASRLLREMVEHDGNHPCIIAWNTVNEIMLCPPAGQRHTEPGQEAPSGGLPPSEWPYARRALQAMNDALKQADPYRPICLVVGRGYAKNNAAGLTEFTDLVAYNGGVINFLEDGEPCIDAERRRFPRRLALMSEGVVNDSAVARADWPGELVHWQVQARHWQRFYERDWFAGGAMWAFADYSARGECRVMGLTDFSRLPCESWHFYRSQWTPALMAHICCHWDWPGEQGRQRTITVFTNAEEAELLLNGRSLGRRPPDRKTWPNLPHPPMQWQALYEPGELLVKAWKDGQEVRDLRVTAGAPAALRLEAAPPAIAADGADVSFVTLTVVDSAGQRCFNAHPDVAIDVEGAARLTGQPVVGVRGGLARVAIRSTGAPGPIQVRAEAQGLLPGKAELVAEAFSDPEF